MSNTLADKLKAKTGEVAPELKLPEGTNIPPEEPVVKDEGFQEQAGELRSITDVVNGPLTMMTALSEASNYEPKEGSYRALRLKRVVMPNGNKIDANIYGYWEDPAPDLEAELKYYASNGWVELVTKEA